MGIVPFVVGALIEVIGAEESAQALRRMKHIVARAASTLIVLIVLSRRVELREFGIKLIVRECRVRQGRAVCRVKGQRRWALKWRAHDRERTKNVGANERGPGGDGRAGIVPDHHRYRAVAQRVDKPDSVSRHVENTKRILIGVVRIVPTRGATVTALIRGDHVIACRRERRHHFAPAIGELREAMQEQHRLSARRFVTRLEDVHRKAVYVRNMS